MRYIKFSIKHLIATVIGLVFFFLLARFLSFNIFANTNLTLQYAIVGFFAAAFGPIPGLLIGLIGHALTDLSYGFGIWWSWVIASAFTGLCSGFLLEPGKVERGEFGTADTLRFIIGNLVIQAAAWCLIAPGLDILIYGEPADKVFRQGFVAGAGNFVITAIFGTLLLAGYARTRTPPDNLD